MGFAHVEFKHPEDALDALDNLDGLELDGHKLNLQVAEKLGLPVPKKTGPPKKSKSKSPPRARNLKEAEEHKDFYAPYPGYYRGRGFREHPDMYYHHYAPYYYYPEYYEEWRPKRGGKDKEEGPERKGRKGGEFEYESEVDYSFDYRKDFQRGAGLRGRGRGRGGERPSYYD